MASWGGLLERRDQFDVPGDVDGRAVLLVLHLGAVDLEQW